MAAAQRLQCRVRQIVNQGEHVYTVTLRPASEVPRFRAGQFLHLALDPYDPSAFWPESRAFSIASSPMHREAVEITYAVHGQFTARMERELVEGRDVWIKMPYGDFVVDAPGDVVLFGGGTGITAFTAYLDNLTPDSDQIVTVAYGGRSERQLIYRGLVERAVQRVTSCSALYFVEERLAEADTRPVYVGRLAVASVWPRLRRPLDATYYLSGPPPMLRDIAADLRARDVAPEAIHTDAWE